MLGVYALWDSIDIERINEREMNVFRHTLPGDLPRKSQFAKFRKSPFPPPCMTISARSESLRTTCLLVSICSEEKGQHAFDILLFVRVLDAASRATVGLLLSSLRFLLVNTYRKRHRHSITHKPWRERCVSLRSTENWGILPSEGIVVGRKELKNGETLYIWSISQTRPSG